MSEILRGVGGELDLQTDPTTWAVGTSGEIDNVITGTEGLGDGAGGERVNEAYSACPTGVLSACDVYHAQLGYCNGSICTSYIEFIVRWDHGGTCLDSCHHIEVWSKTSASSACTSVSYTKEVDNLSCDNDPAGCTPSAPYDGCWRDTSLLDADDASGWWAYYCYEVRLVRDSDNGTEDTCEDYDYHKTLYCPMECGGNGNGPP